MTRPAIGPPATIISPWVDTLCVGGASLVVLLPPLLLGRSEWLKPGDQPWPWLYPASTWLTLLINMPHFMASYRLVYRSRETILRYRWASLYVPGFLLAYAGYALWRMAESPYWMSAMALVSGCYLAWHYTGQTWGMMAAYTHLGGQPFVPLERGLIRGGLRILLIWHVTWYLYRLGELPILRAVLGPLYTFATRATAVAFALGLWGLVRYWQRTGRRPPLRTLVPWAAIFVWYAAMAREPAALFWAQIGHALQYLIFPFRMELNRVEHQARPPVFGPRGHMGLYAGGLLVGGFVFYQYLPRWVADWGGGASEATFRAASMAPLIFLNIHHYFTDGCIWKLSNPTVRAELFAHVRKPAA